MALEMAAIKNAPLQPLIEKSNQLSEAFTKRTQYWIETQPQFNKILVESLLPTGETFIRVRDNQLIPAVRSGDAKRIDAALNNLKNAYQQHRAVIDELVALNDKAYKVIETEVPAQVTASRTQSLLLAVMR